MLPAAPKPVDLSKMAEGGYMFRANGYFFKSKVASGNFGFVYEGEKDLTSVAIKEVIIRKKYKLKACASEVIFMKELDHENIIKYIDHFFHERHCLSLYIVMELCVFDLYRLYTLKRVSLTSSDIRSIFKQLLGALSYAQTKEILHLDITPDNLLLTVNGVLKVGGWGFAQHVHSVQPYGRPKDAIETVWYRAPETLLMKTESTLCVDVWSAGCVIAEVYRKAHPFVGCNAEEQIEAIYCHCCKKGSDNPKPFSSLTHKFNITKRYPGQDKARLTVHIMRDFTDPALIKIITNMLTVNPSERPTASELLDNYSPFYAAALQDAPDNIFRTMRLVMEILKVPNQNPLFC